MEEERCLVEFDDGTFLAIVYLAGARIARVARCRATAFQSRIAATVTAERYLASTDWRVVTDVLEC